MQTTISIQPLSAGEGQGRELVVAWDKGSNVAAVGYGMPHAREADLVTVSLAQLEDLIAALQQARTAIAPAPSPRPPAMRTGGIVINAGPGRGGDAVGLLEHIDSQRTGR